MATSPITSGQTGDQFPTTSSTSSSSTSNSSSGAATDPYSMKPSDFINLMVTQLKNQDPTDPTSSQDLLTQVSQIGQLESSTQLQSTLSSVTLQTQVGSASALIGKSVTGVDSSNNSISGTVNSVSVAGGTVSLQLDSGTTMALSGLASIQQQATTSSN